MQPCSIKVCASKSEEYSVSNAGRAYIPHGRELEDEVRDGGSGSDLHDRVLILAQEVRDRSRRSRINEARTKNVHGAPEPAKDVARCRADSRGLMREEGDSGWDEAGGEDAVTGGFYLCRKYGKSEQGALYKGVSRGGWK